MTMNTVMYAIMVTDDARKKSCFSQLFVMHFACNTDSASQTFICRFLHRFLALADGVIFYEQMNALFE